MLFISDYRNGQYKIVDFSWVYGKLSFICFKIYNEL